MDLFLLNSNSWNNKSLMKKYRARKLKNKL